MKLKTVDVKRKIIGLKDDENKTKSSYLDCDRIARIHSQPEGFSLMLDVRLYGRTL